MDSRYDVQFRILLEARNAERVARLKRKTLRESTAIDTNHDDSGDDMEICSMAGQSEPQLIPVLRRLDVDAIEKENLFRRELILRRAKMMNYKCADLDLVRALGAERFLCGQLLNNVIEPTRFWAAVLRLKIFVDLSVETVIGEHRLGLWMFKHPSYSSYHDVDICLGLLPWEYARIYQWCQISKWKD